MAPLLLVAVLSAMVLAALAWLWGTESGAQWLVARLTAATGGQVAVARLEGALASGIRLSGLRIDTDMAGVTVERLSIDADIALLARAVDVQELRADGIRIDSRTAGEQRDGGFDPALLEGIRLPVDLRLHKVRVEDLSLWQGGDQPVWAARRVDFAGGWGDAITIDRARLDVDYFSGDIHGRLSLAGDRAFRLQATGQLESPADANIGADDLGLMVKGRPDDWQIEADTRFRTATLEGRLRAAGQGDLGGVRLETVHLETPPADAEGRLALRWEDGLQVQARVQLERLSPDGWWAGWPENTPLRGRFELHGADGQWRLDDGRFEQPGSPFRLDVDGAYEVESGEARVRAQWQEFVWPPAKEAATLTSEQGEARLQGRPDHWQLATTLAVGAPGYPDGTVSLEADGNETVARVQLTEGRVLGGRLSGDVDADWSDSLALDANLVAERVNVGAAWPDLPMVLTANVTLGHRSEPARTTIDVSRLSGTMDGAPFEGRVNAETGPDGWRLGALHLNAERLRYGDFAARQLTVAPVAGQDGVVTISATPVDIGETRLDAVRFELDALATPMILGAEFDQAPYHVSAKLGAQPADNTLADWAGELLALELSEQGQPLARLRTAAPLFLADGRVALDDACVVLEPSGDLCLNVLRASAEALHLELVLKAVPLGVSQWFLPHQLDLTQVLDGTVQWQAHDGRLPRGAADIRIGAGTIREQGREEALATGPGRLAFSLAEGRLGPGEFDLPLVDVGHVKLSFEIDGLALDGSGRLDGRGRVNIDDISTLEALMPGLDAVDGRLAVDLALGGTVSDPGLTGRVDLEGGRFDYPVLGTEVRDIRLSGRVTRGGRMALDGGFTAGDGTGKLGLTLDYADPADLAGELRLSGRGLVLTNLPDLRVLADPDLHLEWRQNQWSVGGQLDIPEALIAPAGELGGQVNESDDVVVVGGASQDTEAPAEAQPLRLDGSVEVALGDNVRFDSDLASGRLGGGLTLRWDGLLVPEATGAIGVDGEVRAYGPVLRLDDAFVRFPEVPVTNPVLDLRAVREIYGNTQIRAAGVFISGTAKRPVVEAFTRPFTNEERAWTLLITGSDIDYSRGIGGFDIGTYIAPRLYLSYGISLFDTGNVVGIRYDLKKGFGIKATTGERESGVDASYTIEH